MSTQQHAVPTATSPVSRPDRGKGGFQKPFSPCHVRARPQLRSPRATPLHPSPFDAQPVGGLEDQCKEFEALTCSYQTAPRRW
uniref:Uncharacterized protein n=1 Tax=Setaria viridis TaxID=4556 RepID=A0A4U6UCH1_SETVI|nr:hypothetical protein SEVIR_6G004450v2 [Setaria viridis]